MALKMKENYQKNATAAAKQAASPANVYINRAGRAVTLPNVPNTTDNTQKNNQEKLPNDCEDVESIKGKQSGVNSCLKFLMKTLYFMFFSAI